LGAPLGKSEVGAFSDGEISIKIDDVVRGADVYIVQPTCSYVGGGEFSVNDSLMQLLVMIDALKRASAGHINAVIPYFGYARQDRKVRARDPITAKLVANLLTTAGAGRIITMDLHCAQIQGFFDIPFDHLQGQPLLANYYIDKFGGKMDDVVVVSPDLGSVARSRKFAERLNAPLAIIDKRRPRENVSEIMNIIGTTVEGRRVILADDMIDTAGTITNAAYALKELGAKDVFACCTHAVLSGPAVQRLEESPVSELVITDTIDIPEEKRIGKITELSSAGIFSEAIRRIHNGLSISDMFD
jgi:ribose-phosphate pyrophosphokinase